MPLAPSPPGPWMACLREAANKDGHGAAHECMIGMMCLGHCGPVVAEVPFHVPCVWGPQRLAGITGSCLLEPLGWPRTMWSG